jgi:hypothetical protein
MNSKLYLDMFASFSDFMNAVFPYKPQNATKVNVQRYAPEVGAVYPFSMFIEYDNSMTGGTLNNEEREYSVVWTFEHYAQNIVYDKSGGIDPLDTNRDGVIDKLDIARLMQECTESFMINYVPKKHMARQINGGVRPSVDKELARGGSDWVLSYFERY